jgi:hypothetical protein
MALVKYNNNSISSVTALDSIASGGLNLLATNTISSGVSSSSFTSNIDSTYDTYIFKFINIHPQTDNVFFNYNFSIDGGSNYNVTKTTTYFTAEHGQDGTGANLAYNTSADLAQSTNYQYMFVNTASENDQSVAATMYLFNPSSTTFVKHFMTVSVGDSTPDYVYNIRTAGYCNTTSAVNAVDFKMSSGNIDNGIIKMYGLSKS